MHLRASTRSLGGHDFPDVTAVAPQPVEHESPGRHAAIPTQEPHVDFARCPTQSKPRNAREWIGYVLARNAHIGLPGIKQKSEVKLSDDNRRIDFLTRTHGDRKSILFDLKDVTPDSVIEIGLAAGYEDAAWFPDDRMPSETPSMRFQIPLAEILTMTAVREIDVSGYKDRLVITPVARELNNSMQVEYIDHSIPRIGDYYYFRVTHADGEMAWSSPMYVGGSD